MGIMSKLTAAYLAGFIDGEGYISLRIHKEGYYTPILKVALTDEWLLKWIQESYGGWLYTRAPMKPAHKESYYWTLTGKNLKPFLLKIHPYLKLKKEQCRLVLRKIKIQETLKVPHKNISKINEGRIAKQKINFAYREERRREIKEIYLELRKLNKRGK